MTTQRHTQPWIFTSSEIYEEIYITLRTALLGGARIAVAVDGHTYLLGNPSHVRQGTSPYEIYVRTDRAWKLLNQAALTGLAATLNLISPEQHYADVEAAIYAEYPVPKHVMKDFATQSGIDTKAWVMSRRHQITRTVDTHNHLVDDRQLYRPKEGDSVKYFHHNSEDTTLFVENIAGYRPHDHVWRIIAALIEQEFLIQRTILSFDPDDWFWSVYQRN